MWVSIMSQETVLAELRAQIKEKKKELAEQEHALSVVEKMLANRAHDLAREGAKSTDLQAEHKVPDQPSLSLDSASNIAFAKEASEGAPRKSQKELLREVIKACEDAEFTVSIIDEELTKRGMRFEGINPKNRVSVVLSQLESDGEVYKSFTGGGNIPHRYKAKRS
jgi:hypothetical protein